MKYENSGVPVDETQLLRIHLRKKRNDHIRPDL